MRSSTGGARHGGGMGLEVVEYKPSPTHGTEVLEFRLRSTTNAFANSLRRVLLAEVAILAIESVDVRVNTSVYHDEFLVHRLGLVPLASEAMVNKLNYTRECECNNHGCSKCEIIFTLAARCPSNVHSTAVHSSDIVTPDDCPVRPVADKDPGVWLLTLGRGQEIDMKLHVRKNIAKYHSKYMAVATVAMQYRMAIELNKPGLAKLEGPLAETWVNKCPAQVFSRDERTGAVEIAKPDACIYCRECMSLEKPFDKLPAPLVSVRPRVVDGKHDVVFKVETTGAVPAPQVVRTAISVLRRKLEKIGTAVDNLGLEDSVGVAHRPIGNAPTAVRVPNQEAVHRPDDDDLRAALL